MPEETLFRFLYWLDLGQMSCKVASKASVPNLLCGKAGFCALPTLSDTWPFPQDGVIEKHFHGIHDLLKRLYPRLMSCTFIEVLESLESSTARSLQVRSVSPAWCNPAPSIRGLDHGPSLASRWKMTTSPPERVVYRPAFRTLRADIPPQRRPPTTPLRDSGVVPSPRRSTIRPLVVFEDDP
ncbi:uncharacterized protein LY79DRAFT_288053 [Colletotrichum navitas]|uniref:Uncharacterized protein n=1 Tax=Colletotrichum navitas TaxID=681940 RepID=A0AAD8VBF2_9PEZI|nr:uncharacterized protein LY79DRAFT_288053 [Colletotrichum navitas]KAK1598415.1 hypothetical protein LY79DRAFT_288053 [Colletotrichum navitas]